MKLILSCYLIYGLLYTFILLAYNYFLGIRADNYIMSASMAGVGFALFTLGKEKGLNANAFFGINYQLENKAFRYPIIVSIVLFFVTYHSIQTENLGALSILFDVFIFSLFGYIPYLVAVKIFTSNKEIDQTEKQD